MKTTEEILQEIVGLCEDLKQHLDDGCADPIEAAKHTADLIVGLTDEIPIPEELI